MKKLTTAIVLIAFSFSAHAQTNVSGGIYANTTWTLANSPYIVVDTVVVFPNVTLTIQPGVTVKFDVNKEIEIRQAKLIAIGTSADSITFTSNSLSPSAGIYAGIYLNGGTHTSTFDYCKFKYANIGIKSTVADSMLVHHSNFNQNLTGLQFIGNSLAQVALIDNSNFKNNSSDGLILIDLLKASINNCNFSYNGVNGFVLGNANSPSQFFSSTMDYCNFSNNPVGLLWDMQNSIMNHCTFLNDSIGLLGDGYQSSFATYHNTTKNSIFNFNQTGMHYPAHMLIDSCSIKHNQKGVISNLNRIKNSIIDSNTVVGLSMYNDSLVNCDVKYNGTGIQTASYSEIIGNRIENNTGTNISSGSGITTITSNTIRYGNIGIDNYAAGTFTITQNLIENNTIGINLISSNTTLSCNRICSNSSYDLKYYASANLNGTHNYWCTPDSASTETLIYDGYDNISYGLVSILPFDTLCFTGPTSVTEIMQGNSISVYPIPSNGIFMVKSDNENIDRIEIFNMLGEKVFDAEIINSQGEIDLSDQANGIYFIRVKTKTKSFTQKIIVSH